MILIIDDHKESRDVLIRLFRMDGYEASALSDGYAALEFLKSQTPRLIILDYEMPIMDGLTLVKSIRQNVHLNSVPIIMFSASDASQKQAAFDAGINAYVTKSAMDWLALRDQVFQFLGPGINPPLAADSIPPAPKLKKNGS